MRSGSRFVSIVAQAVAVCCVADLYGCTQERVPDTRRPEPASSARARTSSDARDQAHEPLRVVLEQAGKRLQVRLHNQGKQKLIVIRPLDGELLEKMPGLPGLQTLPAPAYRFEATPTAGGPVHRGNYAPMWASASAASEGLGDAGPLSDAKVALEPGQSVLQGVDLPFELPNGKYTVRFSYEYLRSSQQVPPGWFTGTAKAAPIQLNVAR